MHLDFERTWYYPNLTPQNPAAIGTERTRQVEVPLVVAVPILHAGGLKVMVACLLRTTKTFGSFSSDQAALFRDALLAPSKGEGPRKGGLNKARPPPPPVGQPRSMGTYKCGRNKSCKRRTPAGNGVKRANMSLACWNVRTLLDSDKRPGRRSALVALELKRLGIDVAALSEVRFAGVGSLVESVGYTLFWSGKPDTEKRQSGVGFMIKNSIVPKLVGLPTSYSDRIMLLRLTLDNNQYITLFSVYAPTLVSDISVRVKFYSDLKNLVTKVPSDDKIIILGDFNARVGCDADLWEGVLGKHGIGKRNESGLLLLEFCSELQFTITNTLFQQKKRHKTTWMHPRSKHWHQLDFILVRQRDVHDVLHTRVMPSAECHTDHRLVRSKVKLSLKIKTRRKTAPRRKLCVDSLQSTAVKREYQAKLRENLNSLREPSDPVSFWEGLKTTILHTSADVLGFSKRKNQDWFDVNDEEILALLDIKRSAHQAHMALPHCPLKKKAFRCACNNLQRKLRDVKNTWWSELSREIQLYADTGNYRKFYESLKAVYGPSHKTESPLRSLDGSTLLTDRNQILSRWAQHFEKLFSADKIVCEQTILSIPQRPERSDLDTHPTSEEIEKAINQLKSGKAAGIDNIPPELWKHGGPSLHSQLRALLSSCWDSGTLPADFRDAVIVTLYKNKGEKSDCSNYRGITLLSIAGKILARVLLNRLVPAIAEDTLPESQCGFRSNRGTTDMVFALRQIQEKCREQNKGLYISFVDLTKAFDTVNREALWHILNRLGCPPKFVTMTKLLHEEQMGKVRLGNDLSRPFEIRNGVKQGCVLAPTLFSIFFSTMLDHAFSETPDDDAIYIRYRLDGSLFNLRRLKSATKTSQLLVRELLFADDAALVAHTEVALQRLVTCFADSAKIFGLEVSIKKTEVLYQPPPTQAYHPPKVFINNSELNAVQNFKYLGSIISFDAKFDREIENRLSAANRAFGRLRKRVWTNKELRAETKISLYSAVVLTTLLYGSESWVTYRHHVRTLERFHQRCIRSILNIRWWDKVSDVETLEKAKLHSIEALLLRNRLRWAGHVARMDNNRLPKQIMFGELRDGKRKIGTPKKRFLDELKTSLKSSGLNHSEWEERASNRTSWRSDVRSGVKSFEENRRAVAKEKRRKRKEPRTTNNTDSTFICQQCGRVCKSRIGLFSHQRSCLKL